MASRGLVFLPIWRQGTRELLSDATITLEAFITLPDYEKAVQEDESAKDFVPPGKCVHSYDTRGRKFEIWAGSLADPEVRRLLNRAQVFVSFFIEAGTPLETDDPEWTLERWTVYFMYVIHSFFHLDFESRKLMQRADTKKPPLPRPRLRHTPSSVIRLLIAGGTTGETRRRSPLSKPTPTQQLKSDPPSYPRGFGLRSSLSSLPIKASATAPISTPPSIPPASTTRPSWS